MRILLLLLLAACCENAQAQTILDALSRPSQASDIQMLNESNRTALDQANAAAKRASLLTRRANELRSQLDVVEKELESLKTEHAALKSSVTEFHKHFDALVKLFEKQDLAAVPNQVEVMRAFFEKSLLPKIAPKPVADPSSEVTDEKVQPKPVQEAQRDGEKPIEPPVQSEKVEPAISEPTDK